MRHSSNIRLTIPYICLSKLPLYHLFIFNVTYYRSFPAGGYECKNIGSHIGDDRAHMKMKSDLRHHNQHDARMGTSAPIYSQDIYNVKCVHDAIISAHTSVMTGHIWQWNQTCDITINMMHVWVHLRQFIVRTFITLNASPRIWSRPQFVTHSDHQERYIHNNQVKYVRCIYWISMLVKISFVRMANHIFPFYYLINPIDLKMSNWCNKFPVAIAPRPPYQNQGRVVV